MKPISPPDIRIAKLIPLEKESNSLLFGKMKGLKQLK